MKQRLNTIVIITILVLMVLIANTIFFINTYKFKFMYYGESEKDLINICEDLNFKQTSKCLNSYVKHIFNYNLDSNPQGLQQLIEIGGVCEDYAEFYGYYLDYFGYDYEYVDSSHIIGLRENYGEDPNTIYLGDKYLRTGHMFTVGYGDKSYCVLDMRSMDCKTLKL